MNVPEIYDNSMRYILSVLCPCLEDIKIQDSKQVRLTDTFCFIFLLSHHTQISRSLLR
jgi:hypothetical protein